MSNPAFFGGPGTLSGRRKGTLRSLLRRVKEAEVPEEGQAWLTLRNLEDRWGVSTRTILGLEEVCLVPYRMVPSRRLWKTSDILEFEEKVLKQILDMDDQGAPVMDNPPYARMKEERESIEESEYVPTEPFEYPWDA